MPAPRANTDATPLSDVADHARRCEPALQALDDLYAQIDAELAAKGADCLGGGACCRFDLAGHRLYVSTLELARLVSVSPADISRCAKLRCPYQVGPRCTARQARPLGCRAFFCSPDLTAESQAVYERAHRQIGELHQRFGVAYRYVELTAALGELLPGGRQLDHDSP